MMARRTYMFCMVFLAMIASCSNVKRRPNSPSTSVFFGPNLKSEGIHIMGAQESYFGETGLNIQKGEKNLVLELSVCNNFSKDILLHSGSGLLYSHWVETKYAHLEKLVREGGELCLPGDMRHDYVLLRRPGETLKRWRKIQGKTLFSETNCFRIRRNIGLAGASADKDPLYSIVTLRFCLVWYEVGGKEQYQRVEKTFRINYVEGSGKSSTLEE